MDFEKKPFLVTRDGGAWRFTARESLMARHVPAQRAFLSAALEAANPDRTAVVLDLSRAAVVDSLGITLVVKLQRTCRQQGVGFRVEGANPEVTRLFKVFSLNDLFGMQEA